MNNQLIPVFNGVINGESVMLCNARDLHEYLNVGKFFANWITGRLTEYKFVENQDYILVCQNGQIKKGRGGDRRSKDYHLTMDTAKELSMVERNEKGREARRYFIDFNSDAVLNSLAVLKTPYTTDTAPVSHAAFLCPVILNMTGCVANTIPEREIRPPIVYGFEHLVTLSKKGKSKYYTGHN